MDKIQELQQINYGTLFVSILVFIFIIIPLFKYGWQGLEWLLVEKLGLQTKWMRKRKEEHEMIVSNAEAIGNLSKAVMELTEQHKQDMEKSDKMMMKLNIVLMILLTNLLLEMNRLGKI